jgi:hypothetical protein
MAPTTSAASNLPSRLDQRPHGRFNRSEAMVWCFMGRVPMQNSKALIVGPIDPRASACAERPAAPAAHADHLQSVAFRVVKGCAAGGIVIKLEGGQSRHMPRQNGAALK